MDTVKQPCSIWVVLWFAAQSVQIDCFMVKNLFSWKKIQKLYVFLIGCPICSDKQLKNNEKEWFHWLLFEKGHHCSFIWHYIWCVLYEILSIYDKYFCYSKYVENAEEMSHEFPSTRYYVFRFEQTGKNARFDICITLRIISGTIICMK